MLYISDKREGTGMKQNPAISAALSILALFLFGGVVYAELRNGARAKLPDVQESIKLERARWVAGETSVSGLSEEEWGMLTGLELGQGFGPQAPEAPRTDLPPAFDWRDAGGNFVTVPKSQRGCGSCWAFAMTGALESYVLRKEKRPGENLDLSEQVYIACSSVGNCGGGILFPRFLAREGLPPESAYPYAAANGACSAAEPGWERTAYKINSWGMVWPSLNKLKAALVHYGPLPTSMQVYQDFMYYKSGIYSRVNGKRVGSHAVLLVGYNDDERYFILKNNWGVNWGEDGFFKVDYSEMHSIVLLGLTTIAYY